MLAAQAVPGSWWCQSATHFYERCEGEGLRPHRLNFQELTAAADTKTVSETGARLLASDRLLQSDSRL